MHPCEPFVVVHPMHIVVHHAQRLKSAALGYRGTPVEER